MQPVNDEALFNAAEVYCKVNELTVPAMDTFTFAFIALHTTAASTDALVVPDPEIVCSTGVADVTVMLFPAFDLMFTLSFH